MAGRWNWKKIRCWQRKKNWWMQLNEDNVAQIFQKSHHANPLKRIWKISFPLSPSLLSPASPYVAKLKFLILAASLLLPLLVLLLLLEWKCLSRWPASCMGRLGWELAAEETAWNWWSSAMESWWARRSSQAESASVEDCLAAARKPVLSSCPFGCRSLLTSQLTPRSSIQCVSIVITDSSDKCCEDCLLRGPSFYVFMSWEFQWHSQSEAL